MREAFDNRRQCDVKEARLLHTVEESLGACVDFGVVPVPGYGEYA